MPKYDIIFEESGEEDEAEEHSDHGVSPVPSVGAAGSSRTPFVAHVNPVGELPTAKRSRPLSPPPVGWRWELDVLMADGATAGDVAVAKVFSKTSQPLPDPDDHSGTGVVEHTGFQPCFGVYLPQRGKSH